MCYLILEWTQISKFTCCLSPFWNYRWTTCPLLLSFMSIRSLPKWWETQGNTFIIWACPSRGQFVTTSTSKEEDCGACRSRQACISVNISTDLHEKRAELLLSIYAAHNMIKQCCFSEELCMPLGRHPLTIETLFSWLIINCPLLFNLYNTHKVN